MELHAVLGLLLMQRNKLLVLLLMQGRELLVLLLGQFVEGLVLGVMEQKQTEGGILLEL